MSITLTIKNCCNRSTVLGLTEKFVDLAFEVLRVTEMSHAKAGSAFREHKSLKNDVKALG